MDELHRRRLIQATVVLATPALVAKVGSPAYAGLFDGLAHAVSGIGQAVAQGVGTIAQGGASAAQNIVRSGSQVVAQVLPAAAQALIPPPPLINMATDLLRFTSNAPVQMFGMFANSNPQAMPVDFFSTRSSQPMPLRSSDQDQYFADPNDFMRANYSMIADYVFRYGGDRIPGNVNAPAYGWAWRGQGARGINSPGYYPSTTRLAQINGQNTGSFDGILKLLQEIGPLVSLIAAIA